MWTPATREQHGRSDLRSSTDLTEAEWAVNESLLPPACSVVRPRLWSLREIVDGISFVLARGSEGHGRRAFAPASGRDIWPLASKAHETRNGGIIRRVQGARA